MTTKFPIPQGSDKDLEIYDLGDLTGCTGFLAVKDGATIVIEKSTLNSDEGEIASPSTSGVLRFHFVPVDTQTLSASRPYSFDAWIVTGAGKRHQVLSVTPFSVTPRVVVIETNPPLVI